MKFKHFMSVLDARKWIVLAVFFLVAVAGMAANFAVVKQYTSGSAFLLETRLVTGDGQKANSEALADRFVQAQVAVISSFNFAVRVVEAMGLDKSTEARQLYALETQGKGTLKSWLAESLLRKLEVTSRSDSSVIDIQFTSADARLAASVANAFVQTYAKSVAQNQTNASKKQLQVIQSQLTDLKDNMDSVERNITELKQRDDYFAIDERFETQNKRLNDMRAKLTRASLSATESELGRLRAEFETQSTSVNAMKALRSKLKGLQLNLDVLQRSHDFATQRFWQLSFDERPEAMSVVVLKPATVPDTPSLPRFWLNLSLSLLIGLLLGMGIAVAVEAVDRRIRSEADVQELLGLNVLATIKP